uniref:PAZ domain-containing protein n=1 Tax=Panagrellus redivivus TaxID=6233 RepID=A0A7E4W300_PANRE
MAKLQGFNQLGLLIFCVCDYQFEPFDINEFVTFVKTRRRGFKMEIMVPDNKRKFESYYLELKRILDQQFTRFVDPLDKLPKNMTYVLIFFYKHPLCWTVS